MTSLEWIELYNFGEAVSLDGYEIHSDEDVIALPSDVTLAQGEYFIICRRLCATAASQGFESFWGDSSGAWGDTEYESSFPTPLEASFSLTNDSGSVSLWHNASEMSSLSWSRSGGDGDSWERVFPLSDSTGQSIDPTGSTPGLLNSLTPADYDLAIVDINVTPQDGGSMVAFTIANVGSNEISGAQLYVTDTNGVDTVDIISIESMLSADTLDLVGEYLIDERYNMLSAVLSPDDRDRNNSRFFVAVGGDYPPIILSEFLSNPQATLYYEWIEIYNRANETIDMSGWRIGDSVSAHAVCDGSLGIRPGEYAVLVQSEEYFRLYNPDFDGTCIEPSSWASLNNEGDIVRLVDSYGVEADRFQYTTAFENNFTWSRVIEGADTGGWGRSLAAGGTPGAPNEVVFNTVGSSVKVELSSSYISPDGDDFEDVIDISIESPDADYYSVRVYDRQGRVVRWLCEKERYLPPPIQWDGLSDAGKRLPIGIYIIYVEAAGVGAVKKPIVVAR